MPKIIAENIDRLATVEMRPGSGNLPRGVIHRLYEAARAKIGEPLVHRMGVSLLDQVGRGDHVVILTGAGGPPVLPSAEVDGILGAVAIARGLVLGVGADVTIVTEERAREPVRAAVHAGSLNVLITPHPDVGNYVLFDSSPEGTEASAQHAKDLFDRVAPKAVVAIEKLAPNTRGVLHGATGLDYTEVHTNPQPYMELAERQGILTCGIGDGGNEVGFGLILEEVREVMPAGRACLCPCEGGSASSLSTDEFVVAAISDWGGYALLAMLAFLLGRPDVMLTAGEIERMLLATINAGAFDGATGRPSMSDDGVPLLAQRGYADMLSTLVQLGLSRLASPGH